MKEIRFAFVGFGSIAKTHMTALKAMTIVKKLPFIPVLDTLVTRDPAANEEQARAIGFAHVTSSLASALSERPIDIVDVCTPNALHTEPFIQAVQAGKTVYCEKPLTDRYERSKALVEAAGEGSLHQVALVYRYHPAVIRIKELLHRQAIGQVLQARVSYRRSGYLNAARPVSWRLNEALTGGGAISDLGVHVIDLINYLCGEINGVSGTAQTYVKKRPSAADDPRLVDMHVDDWAGIEIRHENGVRSYAEVSRIAWGAEAFQVDIVGTGGSISCDLEKEYLPRVKLLDGSSPPAVAPDALSLSTDDKSTLGMSVDCHFGSLNHFLHRYAGLDRFEPGLAPAVLDCLKAEYWIHEVLKQSGRVGL